MSSTCTPIDSCNGWNGTAHRPLIDDWQDLQCLETPRYLSSFLCFKHYTKYGCGPHKPMCYSSCSVFISNSKSILNDTAACPFIDDELQRKRWETWKGWKNMCRQESECVVGNLQEQYQCGFKYLDQSLSYCKSNDSCCSSPIIQQHSNHLLNISFNDSLWTNQTTEQVHDWCPINIGISCTGFVGGIAGILILLLICLIIFCTLRRRSREKGVYPDIFESSLESTFESCDFREKGFTIYNVTTSVRDNLSLKRGDKVIIHELLEDIYAHGMNIVTGESGTFPMTAVSAQ